MGCFAWLILVALGIFVMLSFIRWFEQTTDAVDHGWWNKVTMLVAMPFTVWFFPSRVPAGRPTPVPRHEPVRGFGSVSLRPKHERPSEASLPSTEPRPVLPLDPNSQPPPGTPKEFLGMPLIPPKKPRPAVDPEKLAKLKQKMHEQGMLGDREE